MRVDHTKSVFTRRERLFRSAVLLVAVVGLLLLRAVNPEGLSIIPLTISCGAATGLPCLFCGMTRALHFVLNGDVGGALYFNWLALPLLALVAIITAASSAEVACGRRLFRWGGLVRFRGRSLAYVAATLCLLWSIQVYLAVTQHKRELLNPDGPLYHLFMR